jgi:hypothetical protein
MESRGNSVILKNVGINTIVAEHGTCFEEVFGNLDFKI